jgi:hypothetical protein
MKGRLIIRIFFISTLILLFNWLTPLEINNYYVLVIISFLSISTFVFLIGYAFYFFERNTKARVLITISIIGFFSLALSFNQKNADWKTMNIEYSKDRFNLRTIETQKRDFSEEGNNFRKVDRIKVFPFIDWIGKAEDNYNSTSWERVENN